MTAKDRLRAAQEEWRKTDLARGAQKSPLRRSGFQTDSGIPIPDLLTPAVMDRPATPKWKYERDLGFPGSFHAGTAAETPGRLWTMRRSRDRNAGDTNQRSSTCSSTA